MTPSKRVMEESLTDGPTTKVWAMPMCCPGNLDIPLHGENYFPMTPGCPHVCLYAAGPAATEAHLAGYVWNCGYQKINGRGSNNTRGDGAGWGGGGGNSACLPLKKSGVWSSGLQNTHTSTPDNGGECVVKPLLPWAPSWINCTPYHLPEVESRAQAGHLPATRSLTALSFFCIPLTVLP